jgi:hypothetical protein
VLSLRNSDRKGRNGRGKVKKWLEGKRRNGGRKNREIGK